MNFFRIINNATKQQVAGELQSPQQVATHATINSLVYSDVAARHTVEDSETELSVPLDEFLHIVAIDGGNIPQGVNLSYFIEG